MFARFLGRNNSVTKEETPETPDVDESNPLSDSTNKGDKDILVTVDSHKSNNAAELKKEPRVNETELNNQGTSTDEIALDIVEEESNSLVPEVSAGWVVSMNKKAVWPASLTESLPLKIRENLDRRKISDRSLDEKMYNADKNREAIRESLRLKTMKHNSHAAHVALLKKDKEASGSKLTLIKIEEKLEEAEKRRQNVLNKKRQSAVDVSTPEKSVDSLSSTVSEESYDEETPYKRMESAVRIRNVLLQETSRRAGEEVERARAIAQELAEVEEIIAERTEREMNNRLQRAEVRRNILLDRRRLAAGRHGNYVKSVYLTNRYMERRSGQMLQHNQDAATFRREVKLEEIKSNARQHNLSAQFRACCAYRLFDAKWLNKALRSTAAQTTAKMRRDMIAENMMKRLRDAEVHRSDVLASHKFLNTKSTELVNKLQEKMDGAQQRREMILYERKIRLQERATTIIARKRSSEVEKLRKAKMKLKNKLEQASRRRAALLERRRVACATRNWHAKILSDRQKEEDDEVTAVREQNLRGKLEAAAERRNQMIRPIFAELVALRGKRAMQYLAAQQEMRERYAIRKSSFDKIRLASIHQTRLSRAFDRLEHARQVQERRNRMDTFKQQCIASTMFARIRTAEIRRALYQDAIKASAEETINRSEAVRERLHFREQNARNSLHLRLKKAEYQRAEFTSEKVSSALWFLGKVAIARKRLKDKAEAQQEATEEAIANAEIRRAIRLTRKVQFNADRRRRWHHKKHSQKAEQLRLRQFQKDNNGKAAARREAVLLRKVEVARSTSNRVSVARLEKRAEDVVDAAIRTAIQKTMSRNAEARRQEYLNAIQNNAGIQFSHARAVAEAQKELNQVRAEATLEQSKLRLLQTSKRRDNLMTQRKLGHSTLEHLQPYAGLQVIGHAMQILPHSTHVA